MREFEKGMHKIVDLLCDPDSYKLLYHRAHHEVPMPSIDRLSEFMELCKTVIFPGYFGNSDIRKETMRYYLGMTIDQIYHIIYEQIMRGYCFDCQHEPEVNSKTCANCDFRARKDSKNFIDTLPKIRTLLSLDVLAAYEGDPAAKSYGESIFCYPSIIALTHHRIAHELLKLGVPLIPRIISEMAHSKTGIDIHPGATIDEKFFIDHGTGVVIGETCVIGKNVRVYQGVTLGAKSFPMDENGNPIKGIPRHPVVEDDVIIYAAATVLGRVTIGKGTTVGGNVWVTYDVPPHSKVLQTKAISSPFENGGGI